ncbi:RAD51-associated protein 1-like isoform X1 [Mytilus edulis]|uniref:RAD51-associated protein 1-like isoform X1 n=1 Tax=Mytilus edulis TaxID=6550 RepID=UPI0039EF9785
MSDRRPARARKAVDYAKFAGPDDFDDDFADLTPPPSKRAKTSSSKDLQKKATTNTDKKKPTKSRTPLAEKVYERELQAALELSLVASQSSTCDDDEDFKPKNNKKSNVIKPEKEKVNKTPVTSTPYEDLNQNDVICTVEVNKDKNINSIDKLDNSSQKTETVHVEHNVENHKILQEVQRNKSDGDDSDAIIVLEDEEELGKGGRRKSATKTKVIYDDSEDNDSEFSADDEEEEDPSDDDYDEDNDSDFDCGSKKKKKEVNKKAVTPKPTKQTKTNVATKTAAASKPGAGTKTKTSVSVVSSKGPEKSPAITARLTVKSPVSRSAMSSPIVRTVPKWNPPGSVESVKSPGGSVSLQSPSSGGMRVGLSRNQRVKSLHPGLTLKTT